MRRKLPLLLAACLLTLNFAYLTFLAFYSGTTSYGTGKGPLNPDVKIINSVTRAYQQALISNFQAKKMTPFLVVAENNLDYREGYTTCRKPNQGQYYVGTSIEDFTVTKDVTNLITATARNLQQTPADGYTLSVKTLGSDNPDTRIIISHHGKAIGVITSHYSGEHIDPADDRIAVNATANSCINLDNLPHTQAETGPQGVTP